MLLSCLAKSLSPLRLAMIIMINVFFNNYEMLIVLITISSVMAMMVPPQLLSMVQVTGLKIIQSR
jgi:hypothetical protein